MDRLDAARALLGVSPSSSSQTPSDSDPFSSSPPNTSRLSAASVAFGGHRYFGQAAPAPPQGQQNAPTLLLASSLCTLAAASEATAAATHNSRTVSFDKQLQHQQTAEAQPSSPCLNGLDALAALASSEQASLEHKQQHQQTSQLSGSSFHSFSSSSDDDSDTMPPPPSRAERGRRRAVSNPEGMEKWAPPSRRHFVLPASILEEELAEASAAMEAQERSNQVLAAAAVVAALPPGQTSAFTNSSTSSPKQKKATPSSTVVNEPTDGPISGLMSEEEQANLTPDELLKRARSRLLEDLSEGSLNGEKGVLTLPHALSKYKEVSIFLDVYVQLCLCCMKWKQIAFPCSKLITVAIVLSLPAMFLKGIQSERTHRNLHSS